MTGLAPNPLVIPIGFLIGVLISLPIGPINVLALQRAAERGFFGGLAAGIGIMLGDALIAMIAAFSVKAISSAFQLYRWAIQLIGGVALVVSGAKLFFKPPIFTSVQEAASASLADYAWDIPKHLFLTITNPGAVLFLIAIFGGASSFVEVATRVDAVAMTLAIVAGSFTYWLIASHVINRLRRHLCADSMGRINRVAGLALIGLGAVLIGELVLKAFGLA